MAWYYEEPDKVQHEFDFVHKGYRYQFTGYLSGFEYEYAGPSFTEVTFLSDGKVSRTKVESECWEAGKTYEPEDSVGLPDSVFRVYEVDEKGYAYGVLESSSGFKAGASRSPQIRSSWEEVRDEG